MATADYELRRIGPHAVITMPAEIDAANAAGKPSQAAYPQAVHTRSTGCPRSGPRAVRLQLMAEPGSLCAVTGRGHQVRQGVAGGRKTGSRWSRVGVAGDLDEGAEPAGVAKRQAAPIV